DRILTAKSKDELIEIYQQYKNTERPTAEAELIGLVILSKLAELDPTLNSEALNKEPSKQIPRIKSKEQWRWLQNTRPDIFHKWQKEAPAKFEDLPEKQEKKVIDLRRKTDNQQNISREHSGTGSATDTSTMPQVLSKGEKTQGTIGFIRGIKTKAFQVFLFFIGCWFVLWCTLGLFLAWLMSGKQPDAKPALTSIPFPGILNFCLFFQSSSVQPGPAILRKKIHFYFHEPSHRI
ncbi:MAG TPA: hypothetical protein VN963_05375, partial [bacterium]|nr:hypothetical protein [bacterium]